MKKILLFFFCVGLAPLVMKSQTPFSAADSVVEYQLLSTDTIVKMPQRKVVNYYNAEKKLLERRIFIWDKFSRVWVQRKRYVIQHYAEEIMVEIYRNESPKQEIQSGRMIFLLDKQQHLIEYNTLEKDRYSNKYTRRNRSEFTFRNDTLIRQLFFEQGTTFYKKTETRFDFSGKRIEKSVLQFAESGDRLNEYKTQWFFADRHLVKIKASNAQGELVSSDSLHYRQDTLIYRDHFVNPHSKTDVVALESRTFYMYLQGRLSVEYSLTYNSDQRPVADTRNLLTHYLPAGRQATTVHSLSLKPEDFLD